MLAGPTLVKRDKPWCDVSCNEDWTVASLKVVEGLFSVTLLTIAVNTLEITIETISTGNNVNWQILNF